MLQLQTKNPGRITLVLGGARSGKSRYGQKLAAMAKRVTFIATAQAGDDEMTRKIARHRTERPVEWKTIEEPLRVADTLRVAEADTDLIIIDCLTFFASNQLLACGDDVRALEAACAELYESLRATPCAVVLISNEVGCGVVPEYELGRRFRDLAGEINQRVAEIADSVVLMVAGLPLKLKSAPQVTT